MDQFILADNTEPGALKIFRPKSYLPIYILENSDYNNFNHQDIIIIQNISVGNHLDNKQNGKNSSYYWLLGKISRAMFVCLFVLYRNPNCWMDLN